MTAKHLLAILAAIILTIPAAATAGNLEPSADPDNATSAMYTLDDIYNYLDTGIAGTKRTGGFTDPDSAPGPTGHTLDEINEKITAKCITCKGMLNGTRWCDQGDGTVKDMTTGLVWLKDANCIGTKQWANTNTNDDAITWSGILYDGSTAFGGGDCGLSDGSGVGDWRVPTKNELYGLANGTEAVSSGNPRTFTGVQPHSYWSSTTYASSTHSAWYVDMSDGYGYHYKGNVFYVWPVRSDK